jgi:hypothetical protein
MLIYSVYWVGIVLTLITKIRDAFFTGLRWILTL